MYSLEFTKQYLRDLKLLRKRKFDEEKLNQIIKILLSGENLPAKYKDHALMGGYVGYRECHITPDWLLIYLKEKTIKLVTLIRSGTHSDLFK
ncbi:MAG TPA: type II toxin-antitoxin system YafQ family toxin [Prolixibacteraceae bacterium]|nr:type II toxin-antitoxin system YafQ family toxin [Prolixibacteraceae bacterium]